MVWDVQINCSLTSQKKKTMQYVFYKLSSACSQDSDLRVAWKAKPGAKLQTATCKLKAASV